MFRYTVQLQSATGAMSEREYAVHWDPTKVGTEEVARACAAERTVAGGKHADGSFKMAYAGLSAVLLT
jgi:hypothetical protein